MRSGANRSSYFRDAAEAHLRRDEDDDVARYIAAYRDQPESPEEINAAAAAAIEVLAAEPFAPGPAE